MAEVAAAPTEPDASASATTPRRRVSAWAAVVAGATLLVASALATLGVLWATSTGSSSSSYTAKVPGTLLAFEIVVGHGDVEVVGGGPVDVVVERTETSTFGHAPTERRMIQGSVLRIESTCPTLVVGTCEADYRITLPENVRATVDSTHGSIRLTAFRGAADLSTRAGGITVEGFCGRWLHATARAGDVELQTSCPPERLEARADTGDVRVAVPNGTYGVEADSNGGTVSVAGLTQHATARFRIQALSDTGDVTVGTSR